MFNIIHLLITANDSKHTHVIKFQMSLMMFRDGNVLETEGK